MPQTCSICRSPHREAVDVALVAGEPYRHIASRYGTSTGALQRHKPHISEALVQVKEEREEEHGETLLDQVNSLLDRALRLLEKAERAGDLRTAFVGIREARGALELLGKVTGELTQPAAPASLRPMFMLPPGARIEINAHKIIDVTPGKDEPGNRDKGD